MDNNKKIIPIATGMSEGVIITRRHFDKNLEYTLYLPDIIRWNENTNESLQEQLKTLQKQITHISENLTKNINNANNQLIEILTTEQDDNNG